MNNGLESNKVKRRLRFTSYQIIVIGFAMTVLVGSVLLVLPVSSKERVVTPFIDALFTATSAVCVTGLVVRNTATYWSGFGQAVIILLIQIGGVGIITVVAWIARFAGYKIGLLQRSTLQEAVSAHKVSSILKYSLFIFKTTLIIELIGAALLFPVMNARFGVWKGIWYSVFHSVSAFCNAGFDILGVEAEYISVCEYVGDPLLNLTIMGLIVAGVCIALILARELIVSGFRMVAASAGLVLAADMVGTGGTYPLEKWDEKISDSINYLLILRAIVEEGVA